MMRYRNTIALMTIAVGAVFSAPSYASETDAKRCANEIHQVVDRLEQSLTSRTAETVTTIDRLLRAGRFEAAAAAARDCVAASRTDGRAASLHINRVASFCIRHLIEQEQFKDARRLDQIRQAALERVSAALDRQERVLSDALGN